MAAKISTFATLSASFGITAATSYSQRGCPSVSARAIRRRSRDLADPEPVPVAHDDDLAARDHPVVDEQVHGVAGGPVELDHLTGAERQDLGDRLPHASDADRDGDRDVEDQVQVG